MKGKMTQGQMVLAATGVGFLLVAAAAGYFGWSSLGEVQSQAQALAERKLKPELAAILTKPGGAGAARKEAVEIGKIAEEVSQAEEKLVGSWREGHEKASGVGQGWSQDPNQWKDRLIATNDRLKKQSGKKGDNSRVILADDFYLGLQEYKQQNPSADKVPELALQLSVAEKLVELLMDAKKSGKVVGIHGRLGDLGAIDDKYDVAITTACGALNNIVVENSAVAQYCCYLLRKTGAGVATFVMLDKQQHLVDKMNINKGNFPSDRLFDLVKPKDAKYLPGCFILPHYLSNADYLFNRGLKKIENDMI